MPPPFDKSITTTNYTPSGEERIEIEEFIRSSRKEMDTLQGKELMFTLRVESLNKAKEDVQRQIKEIEQQIESHKLLLSPARKVPDDIYREVFLWCLPHPSEIGEAEWHSVPLLLTQICRRWRQIAHATPLLWTNLSFTYHHPCRAPLNAHLVQEWVKRSGALPISVTCDAGSEAGLHPVHLDLFSELAQSFERWKSLNIVLRGKTPDVRTLINFLDAYGESNPFLQVESLDLSVVLDVELPPAEPDIWFPPVADSYRRKGYQSVVEDLSLQRNKKLRRLNIYIDEVLFGRWHPSQSKFALAPYLPCSQLKHLQIGNPGSHDDGARHDMQCRIPGTVAFQLLRECPNLVTFQADLEECSAMVYPPERVRMKKLQHMSLSLMDLSDPSDLEFLPYLEFPSLTSLTVRSREQLHDSEGDEYDVDALPFLLDAVGANITKLILNPCLIGIEDLVIALSKLPSVVQLYLKQALLDADFDRVERAANGKWGNALLECLTPKSDQTPSAHFCPRLQYLKWENNTWFSDRALADFIIQRATSPHSLIPLKQVHIIFGRCMQEDIRGECAQFLQEGLELRLEYLPEWELGRTNVMDCGPGFGGQEWSYKDQSILEDDPDTLVFGWPIKGISQ
ncbi:hypothetical protein NMY22_g5250 [Coprinellus aureogranulatus]|nr:hypothetical protein NMY22_g5250 [Coprinellus aureogranulatus]